MLQREAVKKKDTKQVDYMYSMRIHRAWVTDQVKSILLPDS